jgi:integrative and conjugative element protein (TIGR02256 family)
MVRRILWLHAALLDEINAEAVHAAPCETGGMLMGYVADNGDYVVTQLIGPGPNAKHSRYRFLPDNEYQQEEIARIFEASEGKDDYLGDWHTHPNGACAMSWLDKRTLQKIATTPGLNIDSPVTMIACRASEEWKYSAWRFGQERWLLGATVDEFELKVY